MNDKLGCTWLQELAITSDEGLSLEDLLRRVVVAGAGHASLFVSHPGFPPSSPLHFNLLGVFYAIHVAVEGCRTCMLLLLLFKLILIFSVILRFGFPLFLSPDVLSDLKSLFTLLLVVS
jgi:hypothetical protein